MTSRNAKRVIFGTVCLLFIGWLIIAPPSSRQIDEGLLNGALGGLSAEDSAAFLELLKWQSSSTHRLPVNLNSPAVAGALNIYTVSTNGYSNFACQNGNALYDARSDAILIDAEFVKDCLQPEFGVSEVFSTRRLFLLFLLAHETGHRQRHRGTHHMYFDLNRTTDPKLSQLEDEADDEAVETLRRLNVTPLNSTLNPALARKWFLPSGVCQLFGGTLVAAYQHETNLLGNYPKPDDKLAQECAKLGALPAEDRFDIGFTGWLASVPRAMLRADNPFSAFHSDSAHASFVDRLQRIFRRYNSESKLLNYSGNEAGFWGSHTQNIAVVQRELKLLSLITNSAAVEITTPDSIDAVSWNEDSLFIMTRDGRVYRMSVFRLSELQNSGRLATWRFDRKHSLVNPDSNWSTFSIQLWPINGDSLLCFADDNAYSTRNGKWVPAEFLTKEQHRVMSLVRDSYRTEIALAWTGSVMAENPLDLGELRLLLMKRGLVVLEIPTAQIISNLSARLNGADVLFDTIGVSGNLVALSVWDLKTDTLLAVATMDAADGMLKAVVSIPDDLRTKRERLAFAFTAEQNQNIVFLARASSDEIQPKAGILTQTIQLFELPIGNGPRKIAEWDASFGRVMSLVPELPEAVISAILPAGNEVHVLLHGWSPTFRINRKTGEVTPIFYPGGHMGFLGPDNMIAYVPLSGGEASFASEPGANCRCFVLQGKQRK